MERARIGLKNLLRRGIKRGIFSAVLDEELGVTLLLGPMIFSHIFGPRVDRKWIAAGAVESFWKAHARNSSQTIADTKLTHSKRRARRTAD
jgi:hypothetical protein